jgi:hypothetical protein
MSHNSPSLWAWSGASTRRVNLWQKKRAWRTPGTSILRYYLIEGANLIRQHNLEYQAYYRRKFAEVPKHPHKRALVLTARKLVRLVFALLTKNQTYVRPQAVQSQEAAPVQ